MTRIADRSVSIQTSSESVPATPSWFGEVVLIAEHLRKSYILTDLGEDVRFARRRFGRYEVIDFLAVLFGYVISGERTDGGSSTSASSRWRSHSWPCLSETSYPPVQRSLVF